jgi:hypothetical protein
MKAFLALLLPALCAAAPRTAAPNSAIATLHSLESYLDFGARSLDGSPYEIWVALAPKNSPNSNRWVLDIMGGA